MAYLGIYAVLVTAYAAYMTYEHFTRKHVFVQLREALEAKSKEKALDILNKVSGKLEGK